MDIFSVITLFGGLALFLFGMTVMGDSLDAHKYLAQVKNHQNEQFETKYNEYAKKYHV